MRKENIQSAWIKNHIAFIVPFQFQLNLTSSKICNSFNIKFPDCDEECDRGESRSFTSYADNDRLSMYPNPANSILNLEIENSTSDQHTVIIYDQLGRAVLMRKFDNTIKQHWIKWLKIWITEHDFWIRFSPSRFGWYLINKFLSTILW